MDSRKMRRLLHGRRAVSAVISNVILMGAVIAVSFVVLVWARNQSSAYNNQYGNAVSADISSLQERLTFEYVFHNRTGVYVYLMNSGTVNNVTVKTVYIENATWTVIPTKSNLKHFNGTNIADQDLDTTEQGYFVLSSLTLKAGTSYSVLIITGRGSSFENTFVA